jgi:phosphoribosylglycinamide formyltransferase-1
VVVLLSGSGSLCQALLDAAADPAFGVQVVAVGSDREGAEGLARAERAGVPTFVEPLSRYADRAEWDAALTKAVAAHEPDLVVLAGFMRLIGAEFLAGFDGRCLNSHPALSPSFPGAHAVRDALAYGVQVTGATIFLVDAGVDTGAIVAQQAVKVCATDDETTLHERIKTCERTMLVDVVGRMCRDGWTVSGRKVTIP